MHIGYCISCYESETLVFSAPISTSKEKMREVLGREHTIGGADLTQEQFLKLRLDLLGEIEIGWEPSLTFCVEGMNLPDFDFTW